MIQCLGCKGLGKVPTDLWENTISYWKPCPLCFLDDSKLFDLSTKEQQIHWFVKYWKPNMFGAKTWYEKLASKRPPDFIIGGDDDPYMLRWWVIPKNKFFNIYLHRFLRSDEDRALHDHPWWNISYLLNGTYKEHTISAGGVHHARIAKEGSLKFRFAKFAHRIELHDGYCWSLFITGPKIRDWGFHCPNGWRPWQIFTSPEDKGMTGRGCD